MPHPISQCTKISRAKYLNESGVLLKVPKDEGKYGFIDDFERLITGDYDGGIRKIMEKQGKECRQSLNKILDTLHK